MGNAFSRVDDRACGPSRGEETEDSLVADVEFGDLEDVEPLMDEQNK